MMGKRDIEAIESSASSIAESEDDGSGYSVNISPSSTLDEEEFIKGRLPWIPPLSSTDTINSSPIKYQPKYSFDKLVNGRRFRESEILADDSFWNDLGGIGDHCKASNSSASLAKIDLPNIFDLEWTPDLPSTPFLRINSSMTINPSFEANEIISILKETSPFKILALICNSPHNTLLIILSVKRLLKKFEKEEIPKIVDFFAKCQTAHSLNALLSLYIHFDQIDPDDFSTILAICRDDKLMDCCHDPIVKIFDRFGTFPAAISNDDLLTVAKYSSNAKLKPLLNHALGLGTCSGGERGGSSPLTPKMLETIKKYLSDNLRTLPTPQTFKWLHTLYYRLCQCRLFEDEKSIIKSLLDTIIECKKMILPSHKSIIIHTRDLLIKCQTFLALLLDDFEVEVASGRRAKQIKIFL